MNIEEAILEKVRALPEEKKAEVLEYVSGLGRRSEYRFAVRRGFWRI
jgi:hypothetical protein